MTRPSPPRRVGILGGMGPEATLLLMRKVLDAVPAEDDADHVPLLVDQNPQVPSRIRHLLEGGADDPAPVLSAMAARLEAAGAEALAVPCNTAHHYLDAVRSAAGIPVLDMVGLSAARVAAIAPKGTRIGILASPAVRRIALFEPALARHGLTALHPADGDALLSAIRRIKAEGPSQDASGALRHASGDLVTRGATLQLIACTEFSLIADAVAPDAHVFDTLDLLVEAIVAFSTRAASDSIEVAKARPSPPDHPIRHQQQRNHP